MRDTESPLLTSPRKQGEERVPSPVNGGGLGWGLLLARSLLFYFFFWGWTIALGLVALPALLSARLARRVPDVWIDVTLWLLRRICGLRVAVCGERLSHPAIYASKHQSALDTLVLWRQLGGPAFILKRELLRIPIFGWYLWRMQPIAINRGARSQALQAIREQAARRVAADRNLVIFPEGTRTRPGTQVQYKTAGISVLYQELNIPIVPVALNTGLFWGRNALLKHPGTTVIEYLPPIAPGLPANEMLTQVKEQIEEGAAKLFPACHAVG